MSADLMPMKSTAVTMPKPVEELTPAEREERRRCIRRAAEALARARIKKRPA